MPTTPHTADKKLIIEAQRLFRKQKHGMDVVALEILQRLKNIETNYLKEVVIKEDEDNCLQTTPALHVKTLPAAFYPLWEQRLLSKYADSQPNAVLHCTGNTAPLWGKTPLIVTIHDLIFLEENYLLKKDGGSLYQRFGNVYRSLVVPRVAKKAAHVITVSNFQRELIIKRLKLSPSKVSVVYNGADERFFKLADDATKKQVLAKYGIHDFSYIFFLANTEPRKNTDGVIKAFADMCRRYPAFTHQLVIKGLSEAQLADKIESLGAADCKQRFHRVGYIDYDDLPILYQGADLLWFPSFTEGFGLPIVEAMAGGTPVITSNVSVMPEIAGEAALYVDPTKPYQLVERTMELFKHPALHKQLVENGFKQAAKFTWVDSVNQLLKVYQQVLSK